MKKLGITIFLIFISLMARTVIFANDGSLRIDTSLNDEGQKNEIQFFEQESDLANLFQPETDELIENIQNKVKESYRSDKTELFIEKIETENIVERYQPLLFTPETMVKNNNYGVSLRQKKQFVSWQVMLFVFIGLVLTVSQFLYFRKKSVKVKKNNK